MLNLHHGRLLLHDERVHVLEQLRQLHHLLLNLDQHGVAVLHRRQGRARAALPVALHQGLAKDLAAVGVVDGGAHLGVGGVGAHDAVLALHLALDALAELRLGLLVLLDGGLEAAVDAADLGVVLGRARVGARLDEADALREGAVLRHGVGRERVELAAVGARGGAVSVVEDALLEHAELLEAAVDGVDAAVKVPALVEDAVGVAAGHGAGVLGQGGHFDVAAWTRPPVSARARAREGQTVRLTRVAGVHGRVGGVAAAAATATVGRALGVAALLARRRSAVARAGIPLVVGVLCSAVPVARAGAPSARVREASKRRDGGRAAAGLV